MQGFSVNYSVPEERLCSECNKLGGKCGFDSVLSQLVCLCGDRPCPFALTLPPEGSPTNAQGIGNFGATDFERFLYYNQCEAINSLAIRTIARWWGRNSK